MSLCNIDSVGRQALQYLAKIEPSAGIELLSYKRDRSVAIIRLSGGEYLVRENGYQKQDITTTIELLSRLLKTMIKREFPRSRKVRLHKFKDPVELDLSRRKI